MAFHSFSDARDLQEKMNQELKAIFCGTSMPYLAQIGQTEDGMGYEIDFAVFDKEDIPTEEQAESILKRMNGFLNGYVPQFALAHDSGRVSPRGTPAQKRMNPHLV